MNKPQGNFAGVALCRTFEIRWFPQKPTGRWEDDPLVKPRAGEELKGLNWCQPQPRVDRSQTSSTCSSGIISDKMDQSSIYSKSCMVLSWFREKFYRDWVRASLAASWKALPVTLAHGLVSLRILNSRLGDIPHFQTHQITIFISIYIYPIVSWWLIVSDTPKSKELIINIYYFFIFIIIIIIYYWLLIMIDYYYIYMLHNAVFSWYPRIIFPDPRSSHANIPHIPRFDPGATYSQPSKPYGNPAAKRFLPQGAP